jgi:nicotinamidase-related amidase
MPIVQFLKRPCREQQPLICFVDLQVEYVAEGRALALDEVACWTANCRELLSFAREQRRPIAHFRQLRREPLLNPATSFSGWIEEFRPRPSEMVFERALPSCYAATEFAAVLDHIDNPTIILAGLTGHGACLATVLDGFHRRHHYIFVRDASWTPPIDPLDAPATHACVSAIIGDYAEVSTTAGIIRWLGSVNSKAENVGGLN